ncbi:MAG: hypothetical protein GKC53_01530 [Neisseriaceae bacterium]|nr:MAG: hypothetical protein GKC53_01530 [Neisseriaceae bacterium]
MSYFNGNQLQRNTWRCSLNLEEYFKHLIRGFYYQEHEYVVTWYDNRLLQKSSDTLVEVTFINLTKPDYISKTTGAPSQSFVVIALPVKYLHKVPFGSIWKGGKSKQKFKFKKYKVTFSKSEGLSYIPLWRAQTSHPFEAGKYVHPSYLEKFKKDGNNLLVIRPKNINKSYIIHPLHFFIAHYGNSSALQHILITYTWDEVEGILKLNELSEEKKVSIPNNFTTQDVVFLYHLKYDKYTNMIVKDMMTNIVHSKGEQLPNYCIPCWHDQPIVLSFYGIPLGNSVLCSQITGISEPQGELIKYSVQSQSEFANYPMAHSKENDKQNDSEQYNIEEYEWELEKLVIELSEVSNLIRKYDNNHLKLLGKKRKINCIYSKKDGHMSLFRHVKAKMIKDNWV